MAETLLTARESWAGDPVHPGLDAPTPAAVVAELSREDRALRVRNLTAQAHQVVNLALEEHLEGRTLVARVVLFSGGGDSTVLAHIMRRSATHAAHANTTIGIEETRQFVRDTCAAWGLPLIEKVAPVTYRELVVERGFPGPAMHFKMYQRLKERCLDAVRRDLVVDPSRERVLFLAGRRRAESARRASIPLHERRGSTIWASPLAMWTALDLATYRAMHDVPVSRASSTLHMSGECLCGAFAKPGELDEIGYWYPEVRAEIEALEAEVRAAGHPEPFCRWGHGQGAASKVGPLCGDCEFRFEEREADDDR